MDNSDRHLKSTKYTLGKRSQEMEKNYLKCLNILLTKNMPSCTSDSVIGSQVFMKQIRLIINKRDSMHNTPLHYAAVNWPQEIVRKLLNNGANVGMKNLRQEIPLSRIPSGTLEEFLDENCMVADGYEVADDENINGGEETCTNNLNEEDDKQEDIEFDPEFLINLNQSDVTFKYGFLAPPVTEDQLKTWDEEKQEDLETLALPETDSLLYISQSKEHRHLVTHPVIRSYLWIKWKRMRKFYNRNIRVYLLFVVCLTWYIFAQFGGKKWEKLHTKDVAPKEYKEDEEFCKDVPPNISFNNPGQYGFWYIIFTLQVIFQFGYIGRDLIRDIPKKPGREGGFGSFCSSCCSFCSASWIDLLLISLMVITLLGGMGVLWLDLTILFGYMAMREMVQMASSITGYFKNLGNSLDMTLLSLVAIILFVPNNLLNNESTYTLGLYSDEEKKADNTSDCSIKRCMAAVAILISWIRLLTSVIRHPMWGKPNVYLTMFKRVMNSFLRFIIWYAVLIVAFGLGFYIMLHKDIGKPRGSKSASKSEAGNTCPEEEPYGFFDTPWLSLVKTSTMFVGEIEFSDIPIDGGNVSVTFGYLFLLSFVFLVVMVLMNLLNGLAVSDIAEIVNAAEIESNISTINTISYFESVLLGDPMGNDMYATQDASFCRCLKSMSLLQVNYLCNRIITFLILVYMINVIHFTTSFYRFQGMYALCPMMRRVFQKIIGSTGMLLFYSYLSEKQLTLPLKQSPVCENNCACINCCTSCLCPCGEQDFKGYVTE